MEYVYKIDIIYRESADCYKWILWRKLAGEKDTEWRMRSFSNASTEESARADAEILMRKDYLVNLRQFR